MNRCTSTLALALSFCVVVVSAARAETSYDQPWLGKWPERWGRLADAEVQPLPGDVRQADLIVVATAKTLQPSKDRNDNTIDYTGDVQVAESIKGDGVIGKSFHLKWKANTTGIDVGARHIFFLKTRADGDPLVLRSCYLHNGAYRKIRLYGAVDSDVDAGLHVLRYLVTSQQQNLGAQLLRVRQSKDWGDQWAFVHMAAAVGEIGTPVFKNVVAGDDPTKFDVDQYCIAVYRLAALRHDAGLKASLSGLSKVASPNDYQHVPESSVFCAVGTYGTKDIVPFIEEMVNAHPEWAVSAAYALAQIGGEETRAAIDGWMSNPKLAGRTERIPIQVSSKGIFSYSSGFGELFNDALKRVKSADKSATQISR